MTKNYLCVMKKLGVQKH